MKMKIALAASAAALCSLYTLTAASATQFEGVYIGLHGGVASADADYVIVQPLIIPVNEPLSFSDTGAMGGVQLGVRFDLSSDWVLGLEGTYTAGTVDDTVVSTAFADRSRSIEISDQFTAVAQLGYVCSDDWLFYLKGGYANANIATETHIISSGVLSSASSDRDGGWTVGAGIDHAIAPNVVLGLSYDYSSYSPDDRLNVHVPPFAGPAHVQDIEANVHLVTARLSWTF